MDRPTQNNKSHKQQCRWDSVRQQIHRSQQEASKPVSEATKKGQVDGAFARQCVTNLTKTIF